MGILERALNIGEGKQFRRYEQRVETINAFEPELALDSDAELRERMDALRERAAEVDVVPLYETVAEPLSPETLEVALSAAYVTFTSSSTVRFWWEAVGGRAGPRTVSIGPVTSSALRERGVEPDVEAARHDIAGLVQALVADAGPDGR